MLKLKNIKKEYSVAGAKFEALKGLDICFRKNEFVSILGPSGCGKTTTLNIIGGLDHYSSGDLVIAGKSTKEFKDKDWDVYRNHRVGFIFQSYNLIPHQTIEENVELALTIAGVKKDERKQRAREALDKVGLKGAYNKKPNQLSGGQCQRVAIARALINNPEILLADEPTGALDTKTSVQIMELIKEISKETLVIMVTHNPELAEKYSSRIISLLDGEVVEDTNPYTEEEENKERENTKLQEVPEKAKMSFLTAFKLSFKNLLSKKKRTIMTIIAGSIGIIGISAVLAVSNGVKTYINDMQEDMLSGNPVTISESALDYSSLLNLMTDDEKKQFISKDGYVNVNSMVEYMAKKYSSFSSSLVTNNITEYYIKYIEAMPSEYYAAMKFDYDIDITNNIYAKYTGEDNTIDTRSISAITNTYNELLKKTDMAIYSTIISSMSTTMAQAPSNTDYILSQYNVLSGKVATASNEVMLVVDSDTALTDILLGQLGYYTQDEFLNIAYKASEYEDYNSSLDKYEFTYDELLNREFIYYKNDQIYTATNNEYIPFNYNWNATNLTKEDGKVLKVVGILQAKEEISYGCLSSGFYYTEALTKEFIQDNYESKLVEYLSKINKLESGYINGKLSGLAYKLTYSYKKETQEAYSFVGKTDLSIFSTIFSSGGNSNENTSISSNLPTYSLTLNNAGGSKIANEISIYSSDFESKDLSLAYLDKWNEEGDIIVNGKTITYDERTDVKYSDTLSLIISLINGMINIVTIALVAFTCLSLVVSCVMIAIITYVSVVERVKEIGVIRSLGGRKKDVNNLFNAETIMIGLSSGLFGVVFTYLLQGILNLVVETASGIPNIMLLTPLTAIIMILLSLLLTVLSGALPASKASHQDPVEALRSE